MSAPTLGLRGLGPEADPAVRNARLGMRLRPRARQDDPAPKPRRRRYGLDAVAVLSVYVALLELVPSGWTLPSLGAAGTLANIYALLVLLWYLASWLAGRLLPASGTRAVRVALLLFAVSILISYTSLAQSNRAPVKLETQAADRGLIGLLAWIGVVVVASAAITDLDRLKTLLRRMVVFGSFVGALGIVEFMTRKDLLARIHVPGLHASSDISDLMTRGAFTRPSSTAAHPLELAGVLAMLLPFAIQQAVDPARRSSGRLRRWLPVALIGGALPMTVSRTSMIGLIVVLVVLVPTWKSGRRWAALGFLAVGAGVMKLAVPGLISTVMNLFSAFLGSGDNSTQARTMDYAGVAQYVAQRPLFGRGWRTFIPTIYRYTDNQYLLAVVEIGIVGALCIIVLYLTGIRCARRGRELWTDEPTREIGQSFVAAMAAALVVSATFDSLGFPMFAGVVFLLLGCSGAYLGISRREGDLVPRRDPAAVLAGLPPAFFSLRKPAAPSPAPAAAYMLDMARLTRTPQAIAATLRPWLPPAEDDTLMLPIMKSVGVQAPLASETGEIPVVKPEAPIGGQIRKGVRWSFVNTVVMRLGNFLMGVVLARGLLGPRDWGLYAIGLVALAVLLSANELGVSLAIVRWDEDPKRFAPTVLTMSVISSVLLYLVLFFAAPEFARLLGASDATAMLRVLGIAVIIDGVACVPAGVLTRNFAQRQRMFIDAGNFVLSSGLTIGLAVAGFGAMSFAWGSIAGNVVALVGCAIAAPGHLRPGWDRRQARRLLAFGVPLAGASLLVLAMLNVDSIVVGATLGPIQLGLYQIAFNISSWPVRSVSEIARRVSFAGFSRVAASRAALSESFESALALLMAAAVPACALLAVMPKPLIYAIYGERWTAASGALRFLALLGLLRVAFELAYDCLVASGRRRALITVQGWWLLALIPTLILMARARGIAGVGAGHILVAGPLVAPVFLWALSRGGISPLVIARACARPFVGGALMTAVALAIGLLHLNQIAYLFLAGAAAFAVYIPVVWPLRHLAKAGPRGQAQPEPEPDPGPARGPSRAGNPDPDSASDPAEQAVCAG
ncbi:oligosaccharide flippase family protein [Actinocrinis puniceicyclus]|uniref:Oligosaccharide flippase family protein n=1 Tax=Actinocrinis puniceicyclus TaxID=977794 RepID=A0A8J7WVV5_9ACTN|nr:oligosaccharide flippase family protein [Actinocrinis puniceicyclus]MBS2966825.1 oligosaccharide flippase family protein [Actinocrinis puniceicyclus]